MRSGEPSSPGNTDFRLNFLCFAFHCEIIGNAALIGSNNHDNQNHDTSRDILQRRFQSKGQKTSRHHRHDEIADKNPDHQVAVTQERQPDVETEHAVEQDVRTGEVLFRRDLTGDGNIDQGRDSDKHAAHHEHKE